MSAASQIWSVGIRVRNEFRKHPLVRPLWDPLEGFLWPIGARLFPAPKQAQTVRLDQAIDLIVPAGAPSYRTLATGLYERAVVAVARSTVQSGMTVIDIGANIGFYSTLFSRLVGPSGRVFAFEPDPEAFSCLEQNLQRNSCSNVVANRQAVSGTVGLARFVRKDFERGFLSKAATPNTSEVQTTTLDEFMAKQGGCSVDFVKMDIEGAEVSALSGMQQIARANPALRLIVEVNSGALERSGYSEESLRLALSGLGYERAALLEEGMRPIDLATALPKTHTSYNLYLSKNAAG